MHNSFFRLPRFPMILWSLLLLLLFYILLSIIKANNHLVLALKPTLIMFSAIIRSFVYFQQDDGTIIIYLASLCLCLSLSLCVCVSRAQFAAVCCLFVWVWFANLIASAWLGPAIIISCGPRSVFFLFSVLKWAQSSLFYNTFTIVFQCASINVQIRPLFYLCLWFQYKLFL